MTPFLHVTAFAHPDLAPAVAAARALLAATGQVTAASPGTDGIDRLALALQCACWADDSDESPETGLNALERTTAWLLSAEPDGVKRLAMLDLFAARVWEGARRGQAANAAARAPAAGSA